MENDYIEATVWIKREKMLIRRDALEIDDHESWQSLWKNKFGSLVDFPWKEFGWEVPVCPHCGK